MINYEKVKSSFYEANQAYCQSLEKQFQDLGVECSGFCNAFGYELTTNIVRDTFSFKLIFIKYQTTQNGVLIPFDAVEYSGVEMTVNGISPSITMQLRKSAFCRLFMRKAYRQVIPKPYYINSKYDLSDKMLSQFSEQIQKGNISTLGLKNGILKVKIHHPISNIVELLSVTEEWLKN